MKNKTLFGLITVLMLAAILTGAEYKEGDIIFTSDLHNVGCDEQGYELYSIKKDGSGLRRITNNNYLEFHADVSPVRQEIVTVTLFERGSDANSELDKEAELVIWDFEGSIVRRLTDDKRPESVPHWSPDGEKIVFFAGYHPGSLNIYIINRDGTDERRLTNSGYDVDPSFTPEGDIIFSRGKKIMIMDQNGKNISVLADLEITPEDPVFIDKETIGFESKTGSKGNWGFGNYGIFLINRGGSGFKNITQDLYANAMPQPVGDKITFWRITDKPGTEIMIMDKDGSNKKSLLTQISNNQMPTGNN